MYVIVEVPAATVVSTPEVEPIVATDGVDEAQIPPADALLSVLEVPRHISNVPVIGEGNGCTVTVATLVQPVGAV